jgi:site-specific DNA-methyltransferase (adenine-specific)
MTRFQTDLLDLRLGDCMDLMRDTPDGFYDLALVDPPYGINVGKGLGKWLRARGVQETDWDSAIPDEVYFQEVRRVSQNQIIWGANYFPTVWPSRSFALWNKGAGFKDRSYAEGELAVTSFDCNAKVFTYDPLANGDYDGKIHPTQKPVALYNWLLANYANPGQRILDTHLGSGSIAIACHYFGAHLTATEIDPDYYSAAVERIQRETQQIELFPPAPQHPTHEEIPLF